MTKINVILDYYKYLLLIVLVINMIIRDMPNNCRNVPRLIEYVTNG